MRAGINIINQSGQIQVTDSYKNLQFLRKGEITVAMANNWEYTLVTSPAEIVAFRSVDFFSFKSNGRAVVNGTIKNELILGNGSLYYYVFGHASNTAGNYFEVRNANGEVNFSDTGRYMKVADFRHSDSAPLVAASSTMLSSTYPNCFLQFDTYNFDASKVIAVSPAINTVNNYAFYAQYFEYYPDLIFEFHSGKIVHEVDHYWTWTHGAMNVAHNYLAIDVTGL